MLLLGKKTLEAMICHCLDSYPLEACGLLAGVPGEDGNAEVHALFPTENLAASARVYEVEPRGLMRADREAEAAGMQLIGVYHSHTHTDAKPSPTDIASAPDPGWHYVLVSLRDSAPSVRSWLIEGGEVREEPVVISPLGDT